MEKTFLMAHRNPCAISPDGHTVTLISIIPMSLNLSLICARRNPHAGLVIFWVKLIQRGYKRSISGLYRVLKKQGIMAVKPPNPKYIPKPYEQMHYPGQRVQIDVKYVPSACLKNSKVIGKQFSSIPLLMSIHAGAM